MKSLNIFLGLPSFLIKIWGKFCPGVPNLWSDKQTDMQTEIITLKIYRKISIKLAFFLKLDSIS